MLSRINAHLPTGANLYTRGILRIYDVIAHTVNGNYLWKCPAKPVLIPFFHANAGPRHMDVGVGTGYFPYNRHNQGNRWPQQLTLVNINENCLESASKRVGLLDRTNYIVANVLGNSLTLPGVDHRQFDSISLMHVLHFLPCSPTEKGRIFSNLRPYLSSQGTLFGTTILGRGTSQHWLNRFYMELYNWAGVFHNKEDGKEDFLRALEKEFEDVGCRVVGCVLIFQARKPKAEKK